MILAVIVVHMFLTYTRWGSQLYITGGNREAARLSGISVNKISFGLMFFRVYVQLSGVSCMHLVLVQDKLMQGRHYSWKLLLRYL